MNRHHRVPQNLTVLLSGLALLTGCSGDGDRTSETGLVDHASIKIDDVNFVYPRSFGEQNIVQDIDNDDAATRVIWEEHSFEMEDGSLTFDDQLFGEIEGEALVKLFADGTVSIDGTQRNPIGRSNITFKGVRFEIEGPTGDVTHEYGVDRFEDMLGRLVQLKDGQLTIDGVPYGVLEEGDTVSLSHKGMIRVNGEPREAD